MAIKMRVLYNSGKKGMAQFANAVKEKYDLPVNAVSGKFPPEYPCDKERIVILAISAKSEMPDDLRRFCSGLNKTQAQNVALLVDGKQADARYCCVQPFSPDFGNSAGKARLPPECRHSPHTPTAECLG